MGLGFRQKKMKSLLYFTRKTLQTKSIVFLCIIIILIFDSDIPSYHKNTNFSNNVSAVKVQI